MDKEMEQLEKKLNEKRELHLIRTKDIYQEYKDRNLADYSDESIAIVANCKNTGIPVGANACSMTGKSKRGTIAMQLFGVVDPETETFTEAGFRAHGCIAMIACASVAATLVVGKTLDEALQITAQDIKDIVGKTPDNKSFTYYVAQEAIRAAVGDYYDRAGKTPDEIEALTDCSDKHMGCWLCEDCSLRTTLMTTRYGEIPKEIAY